MAIANRFGTEILSADGAVNRGKLGPIVFADPAARKDLETIVHPAVYRAIEAGLRGFELLGEYAFAVVDVPLLYETGAETKFDRVIVTTCSPQHQLARLLGRGMSDTEAGQRIAAQWPTAEKVNRADFVITTDGTFEDTDRQVDAVVNRIRSERE
jgi:dephospho-CoA kinase